jgi:hypothetical protein
MPITTSNPSPIEDRRMVNGADVATVPSTPPDASLRRGDHERR